MAIGVVVCVWEGELPEVAGTSLDLYLGLSAAVTLALAVASARLRREPRLLQEARVFFLARAVLCRARELRTKAVNAGGPIDRNYCSSLKQPCILCASTGLQMRGLDRPDGQREMMAARLVGPNKVRLSRR